MNKPTTFREVLIEALKRNGSSPNQIQRVTDLADASILGGKSAGNTPLKADADVEQVIKQMAKFLAWLDTQPIETAEQIFEQCVRPQANN